MRRSVDPERLKSFIQSTGLTYRNGSSAYIFTCPRCSSKEKLWIRKSDGVFRCWKCATDGFKGRPEFALAELLQCPVDVVRASLYDYAELDSSFNINLVIHDPWDDTNVDEITAEETFKPILYPIDYYPIDHENSQKGMAYLEGRGIPARLAKEYDLYYTPKRRRVCFPVKVGDMLVGWQERLILPNKFVRDGQVIEVPKILSSPGLSGVRDRVVMFQNNLIGSPHAVVCEGPVDAFKAHYCKGAVATMGKEVSKQQVKVIKNMGITKVYLGLDPDAADATAKLVKEFISDVEVYQMETGKFDDLGEMNFVEAYEAFLDAKKLTGAEAFIYIKDYYSS